MPTSIASADLARRLGLTVIDLDEAERIDLTVDGADEINPDLVLIKGAGAALLREKLVWEASDRCVVIAEAAKRVEVLGGVYPLPVEVVAFGHGSTARQIRAVLEAERLEASPRLRVKDGAPVRTDGGNLIYDLPLGAIPDPARLGPLLKAITRGGGAWPVHRVGERGADRNRFGAGPLARCGAGSLMVGLPSVSP